MITAICSKCGERYEVGAKHVCKKQKNITYLNFNNESRADDIIHSRKWKKLRLKVLQRDKYLCQRCLLKYHHYNADRLTVHHIIARIHSPELGFSPRNLITLCQTCNNQLGTQDYLDFDWNAEEVNKDLK